MVRFPLKKFIYLSIIVLIFTPIISFSSYNSSNNFRDNISLENMKPANENLNIDLSIIPDIEFTKLNDLWYNPKIEMLIITPNRTDYIDAVKPLAEWKNQKGVKTIILSNFSLYEGIDDAEKIRNMIKSYYQSDGVRWVLLAGDAQNNLIPIRSVYNPDVTRFGDGRTESVGGEDYKPTDYYYADLNGTWNSDGDGNWGESPYDNTYDLDEISWDPEVYVGRFPADNVNELAIMVNKTVKYESDPEIGDWMNRMLLAGAISDYPTSGDPDGEYESRLTSYIIENYLEDISNYTHLEEEEGTLTQAILRSNFNNGYSTVLMAGHGLPTAYYRNPTRVAYTSTDASASSNYDNPSLVYLDACSTSSYDFSDDSVGETLIKRLLGGAIGIIGGLRVTWYFQDDYNLEKLNRGNAKLFWKEFFINKKFQQGRALYDSKVSYINSDYYKRGETSTYLDFERKQLLTYCLLGDPEVDIYTSKPKLALNPIKEDIYEGQLVTLTIKSIDGSIVPYARVHLKGSNGKYHTAYADETGLVNFRIPSEENEIYNVTITGHNLIPSYFNFTAMPDNGLPQLSSIQYNPRYPKTSVITTINIETYDNKSGIEGVYIFLTKNNFTDYTYYGLSNNIEENKDFMQVKTERLTPGEYSYILVLRDYANNTNVFNNSIFKFSISPHIINYLAPFSLVLIITIGGAYLIVHYLNLKRYSRIVKDF